MPPGEAASVGFAATHSASRLGMFALLLKVFALPVVFVGAASWMMIGSLYARYVPRRM